jgi:hypothetical protein
MTKANDIYREHAAKILGVEPGQVTEEQRRAAKAAFYMTLYSEPPAPQPAKLQYVLDANEKAVLLKIAIKDQEVEVDQWSNIVSRLVMLGLMTTRIETAEVLQAAFVKEEEKQMKALRKQLRAGALTLSPTALNNLVSQISHHTACLKQPDIYGPKNKMFARPTKAALDLFANREILVRIENGKEMKL